MKKVAIEIGLLEFKCTTEMINLEQERLAKEEIVKREKKNEAVDVQTTLPETSEVTKSSGVTKAISPDEKADLDYAFKRIPELNKIIKENKEEGERLGKKDEYSKLRKNSQIELKSLKELVDRINNNKIKKQRRAVKKRHNFAQPTGAEKELAALTKKIAKLEAAEKLRLTTSAANAAEGRAMLDRGLAKEVVKEVMIEKAAYTDLAAEFEKPSELEPKQKKQANPEKDDELRVVEDLKCDSKEKAHQFLVLSEAQTRTAEIKKDVIKTFSAYRRSYSLAPLTFKLPIRVPKLSKIELAFNIAQANEIKHQQYGLLAEKMDAVTNAFPAIIRNLLLERFESKRRTTKQAKQLIRSLYASIRFHMAKD
jgi:hypothetical protein